MSLVDFENIESKFQNVVASNDYDKLVNLLLKHSNIYVIANGGLHYVASHMATDISRLVPNKFCHSFDSFGFITSSANDFGFESIFERWLINCIPSDSPSLLIVVPVLPRTLSELLIAKLIIGMFSLLLEGSLP